MGDVYEGYVAKNKLNKYGSKLIKFPTPKLFVFYNGSTEKEDRQVLKLSDSFDEDSCSDTDIEVKVTMLNINFGRNHEIMEVCKPLAEYSWFVNKVREFRIDNNTIEKAVEMAIDSMPGDWSIKTFLQENRAEVKGIMNNEFNEAEVIEMFKRDAKEEGHEEGKKEGKKEGTEEANKMYIWLRNNDRMDEMFKAMEDQKVFDTLMSEYKEFENNVNKSDLR
ncbi:hypothetical protein [Butyrivibrio sp. NC2002]|uniref:hypothetical protein n=1 Tax=Butyrivibrio sp. NC2002 TaxID=1410610 RepID=UPI00068B07E8|nr:hypothetical protein [Butyrivibrio sp. NC2002]